MPEKHFKSRKEAVDYFSSVLSGTAEFSDEDGELKRIVKNPEDASRFSLLLSSFALTEDEGISTSLEEVEALIEQGRELGYKYTAENIRTEIAKRRKKLPLPKTETPA